MNYLYHYKQLIKSRKKLHKKRLLDKKNGLYFEDHHIIPISICKHRGKAKKQYNKSWNRVLLTAREHFIAHELVYKACKKKYGSKNEYTRKMFHAWGMFFQKSGKRCDNISSSEYERLRIESSKYRKENPIQHIPWNKGKKCSEIGLRQVGKLNHRYGTTVSDEVKKKLSILNSGKNNKMYGVSLSGEKHWAWGRKGKDNPKSKKYKIYFDNGSTIECVSLNNWADLNPKYKNCNLSRLKNGYLVKYKDIIKIEQID